VQQAQFASPAVRRQLRSRQLLQPQCTHLIFRGAHKKYKSGVLIPTPPVHIAFSRLMRLSVDCLHLNRINIY
jgi:hypothetical protein